MSENKTIKLECSKCGGVMEVTPDSEEVICPYCGAKEKILDSDAVAVQKIKSNTYKELEYAKMENENENRKQQEKKAAQTSYRKSFLSKVTIVFVFICIIAMLAGFKSGHIPAGLIALLQVVIFGVSWLMGMQIIKEKKQFLYTALAILGFVLIIPFVATSNIKKYEKLRWPESGLAASLPNPKAKYGDIIINDDDRLDVSVKKYTEKEYEKYLKSCMDMGYTEESETSGGTYSAFDSQGYKLSLDFYSDSMSIILEAPKTMGELKWPDSEIAKMLPAPKSKVGRIEWESAQGFMAYVGDTSSADFEEYTDAVKLSGFDVDYQKGDTYYRADHADGYHVSIQYEGNQTMSIRLDKVEAEPETETETETEMVEENVASESLLESVAVQETESKPTETPADGIRPEFKEAMDSYEEFYDEYFQFVKKYSENASDVTLIAQYGKLLIKAEEMDKNFAKWKDEDLNDVELQYYTEVNTRIAKKSLEIDGMIQ